MTQIVRYLSCCVVMLLASACQAPEQAASLPTLMPALPTATFTITASASPTATHTVTATATVTNTASPTATATLTASASPTPTHTATPTQTATEGPTLTPLPQTFIFGRSVDGNELLAYRAGTGPRTIMLVGGIHTGFESNTVELVERLRDHFRTNTRDILPGVTLLFVPLLNVDGLEFGRQIRGRFNGNEVDLNRNWGCGWSPDAEFANGAVDPGSEPFSEPETRALGSLIERVRPQAVLFYHSAADGVFAGNCGSNTSISEDMARIYGEASGYPYGSDFSAYAVTGSAPAWVDSIGIAAADVELASPEASEFQRNLNAVIALQRWVMGL